MTKVTVRFKVLFATQAGQFFVMGSYLSWGGAWNYTHRRFIPWSRSHGGWRNCGWAIEREITIAYPPDSRPPFRLHVASCTLCQSRDFPEWHNMKREKMRFVGLPFKLSRRRFPRWTIV